MERELHIIYFTKAGGGLACRIAADMAENCPNMESVSKVCGKGILQEWTAENFRQGNVLLFIGACGIAVRAIAPHIGGKDTDPAVLVIDEKGRHVVPILSGHLGGANEWARRIARMTGAEAVLTTATDTQNMFAVDLFAKRNDLQIDDLKKAKRFSARLLAERKGILVFPDAFAQDLFLTGQEPPELEVRSSGEKLREERTPESEDPEQKSFEEGNVFTVSPAVSADGALHLIPRCIILGMGCRKGKSGQELEQFALDTLQELGLDRRAVCAISSIDVKKSEPGLLSLAGSLGVPFETYDAHTLQNAAIENWTFAESERVRETVGVSNVCERAAAAAGAHRILLGKTARDGMTVCVGIRPVELSWGTEERQETGGKTLYVVGIGPGSREGMTEQAMNALAQSETIVGYSVYNDLVRPLFPYKKYLTTPMTGEEKRCRMALQEAAAGHTVSLICSGDPGVYGMAGLVLEMAEEFPEVEVRVISGVTAAMSGAALLGAPLIHDFAVISLSDRLTPWDKIEKRLRAAAEADLCIVLYNPSSRGRKEHLHRAAQLLLESLPSCQVCGIADRIGREGQRTRVMTLKELAEAETDMFSTVFIGNSSTKRVGDKIVTPRGYHTEKEVNHE